MSATPSKKPASKQLLSWLNKQATTLKRLTTSGWKIHTDYLQNAREKGIVLIEVRKRLENTDLAFEKWVKENTEIGLSTAYLWMDVAEWWDDLTAHWKKVEAGALSNPLESSLRGVRDTIRSIRQARGLGKPGSGKKKVTADNSANNTTTPSTAGIGEADSDNKEAESASENDVPDDPGEDESEKIAAANFQKMMARKTQSGNLQQGGATTTPARPRMYKVTVVTPNKADLEGFAGLLPSPTTDFMAHSVSAHIGLQDIDRTLAAVGTCLNTAQPKKVRVVVEL
jgi:hypothetical protein